MCCFRNCTDCFRNPVQETLRIVRSLAGSRNANKRMAQSADSVSNLNDLLRSVQSVFGAHSVNATVLLKLLSDLCYDLGQFAESIEFAKQNTSMLDEKNLKRSIAKCSQRERARIYQFAFADRAHCGEALGLRFLNKLYAQLKKQRTEKRQSSKQKSKSIAKELWDDVDVKILSVLISQTHPRQPIRVFK